MRCTNHSGAEAPEVSPTIRAPSSHAASTSPSSSTRWAGVPSSGRELGQPVRVRGVPRPDHEHDVGPRSDHLHRVLPVLRRVTDVVARRALDGRESVLEDADDLVRLVDRQGGLSEVAEVVLIGDLDGPRLGGRLHEDGPIGSLPTRALDLLVAGMPDQHDGAPLAREAPGLDVHLGDEGTRRIDHLEVASAGVLVDRWRNAVGRQHDHRPVRDLGLLVDEDGALGLQVLNDVQVVHDLLAHVDGRPVLGEGALHRVDGALDPRAIAARGGEQDGAARLTHAHMVGPLASDHRSCSGCRMSDGARRVIGHDADGSPPLLPGARCAHHLPRVGSRMPACARGAGSGPHVVR